MPVINKKWFYFLAIAGLALVYIAGLFVDLMDIDATQYSSMSMEMLQHGHWLQVKDHLKDYLDKPPLLFWLSALSFKIFGIANWSYKLPSLLFSILGFYSTYRFARLYYSEPVARLSALLLASCQAFILFNNDVRTDALLTGSVMFTVWQVEAYLQNGKWWNIIGTGVGVSLALLAKGPIGLVVPVLGFVYDWTSKRQWRNFFKPAWLLVLVIVALMLSPMLYGLHQQYAYKGWYFFFWAQSFGRLTGQNDFVNGLPATDDDPWFFVHTTLWSFLPWSLILVVGFWKDLVELFRSQFRIQASAEVVILAGFTLTFIGLSMSDYKLPYYVYVVYPFAAIIAAKALYGAACQPRLSKVFRISGMVVGAVLIIAAWLLSQYVFPADKVWPCILLGLFTLFYIISLWAEETLERTLLPALFGFMVFNLAANMQGYPSLLKYQAGSQVGKMVTANHIADDKFVCYRIGYSSVDFYSQRLVPRMYDHNALPAMAANHDWVYSDSIGLQEMKDYKLPIIEVDSIANFKVTKLSLGFLDPNHRAEHTSVHYLIKF